MLPSISLDYTPQSGERQRSPNSLKMRMVIRDPKPCMSPRACSGNVRTRMSFWNKCRSEERKVTTSVHGRHSRGRTWPEALQGQGSRAKMPRWSPSQSSLCPPLPMWVACWSLSTFPAVDFSGEDLLVWRGQALTACPGALATPLLALFFC
jgi:hypothetical protein